MEKLNRILKVIVCFALLTAFMGCAATPKHESTGQYVDDTAILLHGGYHGNCGANRH